MLGGLSAIFWALMIVVTLKYVVLIMRANNKGEGGIMALLALASSAVKDHPRGVAPIMVLGVFGASLFYGDAVLTSAISVLSLWRERLFAAMARHARIAGDYFNIPAGQVIELGTKIEI